MTVPLVGGKHHFLLRRLHSLTGIIFGGQPNVGRYRYEKNIFYLLQRVSAIIIMLFMIFHVLGMKGLLLGTNLQFVPEKYALESVKWHFQFHWSVLYLIYPIGILASCYHLANGFWTAAITWGLTVTDRAQKRWGWVCFGLFVLTLVLGMLALFGVMRANPVSAPPWLK